MLSRKIYASYLKFWIWNEAFILKQIHTAIYLFNQKVNTVSKYWVNTIAYDLRS